MLFTRFLYRILNPHKNPNSVVYKFRKKRMKLFCSIIEELRKEGRKEIKVLDVGGYINFWNFLGLRKFLENNKVLMTIINIDVDKEISDGLFHVKRADARELPFSNKSFDLVFSNSVIEHVGSWEDIKKFAKEIKRVGNFYFIQTPSFWFPLDPHFYFPFYHYFPIPFRAWLNLNFQMSGFAKNAKDIDEAIKRAEFWYPLTKNMLKFLFPNSIIITERCAFIPKSYIVTNFKKFRKWGI